MPVARILAQLQGIGIDISKRQVMRLLNDRQEGFVEETRDVLRSGLVSAPWLTVMIPAHEPFGGSEKLQWWTGPNSVTLGGETKANAYVFISMTAAELAGPTSPAVARWRQLLALTSPSSPTATCP